MTLAFFSHNGTILPVSQAAVPLYNIEYAYGFGVYETIRITAGQPRFLDEHCQRLLDSANIIDLQHDFSRETVADWVQQLIAKNEVDSGNIKIMLIGGAQPDLYIQCFNPLYPDRKLYKTGVHTITEHYGRPFPHAKTLNMLPSYLAYRRAKQQGAYDALLVTSNGCITEGTRTNFFGLTGRTLISPPAADILLGVTRAQLLKFAQQQQFKVVEQPIPLDSVTDFDGCFLTSTSSKLMPIRSINEHIWPIVTPTLQELMTRFNTTV